MLWIIAGAIIWRNSSIHHARNFYAAFNDAREENAEALDR
jgi:hypothetical protein